MEQPKRAPSYSERTMIFLIGAVARPDFVFDKSVAADLNENFFSSAAKTKNASTADGIVKLVP
ncbi:MAG: hypothetical protein ACJ8D9_02970 [Xanthobacteraceae bacterium]